ncbi:MAG: tetratricopeptide repeat protein, partial [Candidatus Tectimicrobiota bacterium]
VIRSVAILAGFVVLTSYAWRIDSRLHASLAKKPATTAVLAELPEAATAPLPAVLPPPEPKALMPVPVEPQAPTPPPAPEGPFVQEPIQTPTIEKPRPSADRYFQQGEAAYEAKDYASAADALRRGLALEPDNAVQQAMLAMVLSYQEAWAESAEAYRKALQRQPDNALFHLGLAVALHRLERIDEAVSSLERAVAINPELEEAQRLLEVLTREPEGTLEKVWFTHNAQVEGWEGFWVHTACTVMYWNKQQGLLRATFFRGDDRLVSGTFSNLVLANGQAAIEGPFTPPYRKSRYQDLHLFFPYKGLRLEEGDHRLKVRMDLVGPKGRVLATRWASLALEVLKTASGVVEEARSSSVP